jgi:hypothetical protein
MSLFDHEEKLTPAKTKEVKEKVKTVEIKLPGSDTFVPMSRFMYKRVYRDSLSPDRLLIICDEVAELLMPSGLKTAEGKEEDVMKQNCIANIQSLTQLGRAAGVHVLLASQRNDSSIIPGFIQNNSLSLDTPVLVKRNKE